MKGVITIVGKDRVGIIAEVCGFLAENNVNIIDISQTILQGYFNMIMIVDLSTSNNTCEDLNKSVDDLGKKMGVDMKLQNEEIFNTMHRI